MPRPKHGNRINNSQDISPLEPNNTTTIGPEKWGKAEVQYKDFKIAFMNILEVLKEDMSIFINEIYENANNE